MSRETYHKENMRLSELWPSSSRTSISSNSLGHASTASEQMLCEGLDDVQQLSTASQGNVADN